MTPEVIAAIATAATSVIGAVAALIVAMRSGNKAENRAYMAATAAMHSHFYHDHLGEGDLNATSTANNSPETPAATEE